MEQLWVDWGAVECVCFADLPAGSLSKQLGVGIHLDWAKGTGLVLRSRWHGHVPSAASAFAEVPAAPGLTAG